MSLDSRDLRDLRVTPANLASRVHPDQPALADSRVLQAQPDHLGTQDLRDRLDSLELLEALDHREHPEILDHLDR